LDPSKNSGFAGLFAKNLQVKQKTKCAKSNPRAFFRRIGRLALAHRLRKLATKIVKIFSCQVPGIL
jgi:hypothetical protein